MTTNDLDFYRSIPILERFEDVGDGQRYTPLPPGWIIGVADVRNSTQAIAEGRYKAVNMVGASVIAALMNALATRDFPFVFGGDGAAVALPGTMGAAAGAAMASVRRYAAEALDLDLRVGTIGVDAIRAAGHDVRIARFGVSPDVAFALFSGNGLNWAEEQLKAGLITLPEAAPGAWPDLAGLSCRWEPIAARNGRILSILVRPAPGAPADAFAALVSRISAIVEAAPDRGNPVSPTTLRWRFPPGGLGIEARSGKGRLGVAIAYVRLLALSLMAAVVFLAGRKLGDFDPERYKTVTARNSDFRKFDDGLRMTVDADAGVEARLRAELEEAAARGIAQYGLHAQDAALMTCLVPSLTRDDHIHFIDGAAGGYARAAAMLKQQASMPPAAA
ncbi:DUF3095 family protein [Tepidamorphus gemmatus]|uniref:DUF3095 family protein n=1 Tax=Tepidamorphus gemmatus TaxID=747076 RepID=A0A4R3M9K5_9HYPH|nr:DUF3095 domain-containing protein [Tepidamorphus gemmatus]TCT08407.1 DUF3095 family protein [Tepidamorphus gemmatus]